MTSAAPTPRRRVLLHYAIGLDLVIIAVGAGLLLESHSAALLPLFIFAVALATWRGGWRVGVATTAASVAALWIVFGATIAMAHLILFALLGIATSVFLGVRPLAERGATQPDDKGAQAHRAAELSGRRRQRAVRLAAYAGLPLLVFVVYTNLSDILIRNFSIPSILQPLILLLAIPVLRYRATFRPESIFLQPLTIALIGYSLFVMASGNWARDLALAADTFVDVMKSFGILLIAAWLTVSWAALRGAMVALVAGAVLLSVLALVQVALDDPNMEFGGLASLREGHLYGELEELRPSGPVDDPNYFACILLLAFPAAAFLGAGRHSRIERAAYVAAAGAIALAILFTYSRGGMLALAVAGILLVAAGRVRITWANALVLVVLLAALMPTNVGQRVLAMQALISDDAGAGQADSSVDKRWLLLQAGWQMFTDHPLLGVGAGNFGPHYPTYANLVGWSGHDYTPLGVKQYPHNLYLETAVETGMLGLLLFLSAAGIAVATLKRSRQILLARGERGHAALVTAIMIALAAFLVSSLFLHSGFQRYMWLLLGFAVAAVRLTNDGLRTGEA